MKKLISLLLVFALTLGALFALTGCKKKDKGVTIAIPSDATNEARALLLLQANGYLKLKDGAGVTASVRDIEDNPYNISFNEVEAAQLPNVLQDVDYAVINSNYALSANLNPAKDSLLSEGASSEAAQEYANILAVNASRADDPLILALAAALTSKQVSDFIAKEYSGSVISVVSEPTDGYDDAIDYAALAGQTVRVGASPAPHAEILEVAKQILAEKDITLEIVTFTDYVLPNNAVNDNEIDANFFQHQPYLTDFNAENGTDIVSVAAIHFEPLGLYGGKQSSLDAIQK